MKKPLKQSVCDHLNTYSLTEDQFQNLESLADHSPDDQALDDQTVAEKPQRSIFPFAIAAAMVAFLLAFLLSPLILDKVDIRQRVAMEVVNNHLKLKPLEVKTSSIDGIRDYFQKLDFLPVNSVLVKASKLELIGGRYCSLQGITAAQLRVKKPGSNTVQTLYQTEYRKDVFENMPLLEEGDKPVGIYVKGIKVKIWVEKGLLFALTELPDDQILD